MSAGAGIGLGGCVEVSEVHVATGWAVRPPQMEQSVGVWEACGHRWQLMTGNERRRRCSCCSWPTGAGPRSGARHEIGHSRRYRSDPRQCRPCHLRRHQQRLPYRLYRKWSWLSC